MALRFLLAIILFLSTFLFFWTPFPWLFPVTWLLLIFLILKFQFQLFPISKRIEQCYDKFFYHGKRLGDLPERPVLVIGATHLQTARPFTFSKYWMQDSTYQFMDDPVKFKPDKFPVSRAVMAPSCVPFAFTPISIHPEFFANREQARTVHPILVDGGVYDNQGIHKITQQGRYACPIIITSDAGSGASGELTFRNT